MKEDIKRRQGVNKLAKKKKEEQIKKKRGTGGGLDRGEEDN
jgi:hypothetical protein